jgi:hypothetical protein
MMLWKEQCGVNGRHLGSLGDTFSIDQGINIRAEGSPVVTTKRAFVQGKFARQKSFWPAGIFLKAEYLHAQPSQPRASPKGQTGFHCPA